MNARIGAHVDEINQLSASIGRLNDEIALVSGSGRGTPNDLLDQRDQLVNQLAQRIDVQTAQQDDGSLNVFVGNGQALVVGKQSQSLQAITPVNPNEPSQVMLGSSNISNQIQAGELGGILSFRKQVMQPAQQQMTDLASGLSAAVNAAQASGVDSNGAPGQALFAVNPPSARLHVEISDPALLASAPAGAAAGSGDNSNALAMANALRGPVVGNASAQQANIQLVSGVGTSTRRLEASETAQAAILAQHQNARDEVSGVNLDEEAANLLQYQQAYQAAAQIITTANEMFRTLLAAVR